MDRLTAHAQKKDYIGVDIFLSSDWPSDVTIGTTPPVILFANVHEVLHVVNVRMVLMLAELAQRQWPVLLLR